MKEQVPANLLGAVRPEALGRVLLEQAGEDPTGFADEVRGEGELFVDDCAGLVGGEEREKGRTATVHLRRWS